MVKLAIFISLSQLFTHAEYPTFYSQLSYSFVF